MIWLVGDKGMLGSELAGVLTSRNILWVGSDRDVDITDSRAVADFAAGKRIGWIVNCAAYTAVDKAESERELAAALNVQGPRNLAQLANKSGARILHISTDYVFSGDVDRPYREDDSMDPKGVYGRTKAEGEKAVLDACERCLILRTAWLYGAYGPNFVYTMLRLMVQKEEIGIVADQRGSPTLSADLAGAIVTILGSDNTRYGTYHFTNTGETTWFDFANEVHRLGRELGILERDCKIRALSTEEYPTPAKRPVYAVLSKEKIIRDYGVSIPAWKESLERFMSRLAADLRRERTLSPEADCDTVMRAARARASKVHPSKKE
jgi:dTDP-4-dehydrorhamnose reductase